MKVFNAKLCYWTISRHITGARSALAPLLKGNVTCTFLATTALEEAVEYLGCFFLGVAITIQHTADETPPNEQHLRIAKYYRYH